jgi:hypothetical protein
MSVINSTYLGARDVIPVVRGCTAGESDYRHRIDIVGSQRDFKLLVTALPGPYPALRCQMTRMLCGANCTTAGVCRAPAFCNPSEAVTYG